MTSISRGAKGLFDDSVRLLNQSIVKENIKNIAGTFTFVFGLVEIYDVYRIFRGHEISTEAYLDYPKWVQVANKVVIVCAKISLILSAGVSRPGVFMISLLIEYVFSTSQLNRVFGPNAVFVVNPWHPRHLISIVAVILALPSVVQSVCKSLNWTYKKIRQYPDMPTDRQGVRTWLTDNKIRFMTLFNTVTSRPILHIRNQLVLRHTRSIHLTFYLIDLFRNFICLLK